MVSKHGFAGQELPLTTKATAPSLLVERAQKGYFGLLLGLTIIVGIASFARDRGPVTTNVSLWLFLIPFFATLVSARAGLVIAAFLLSVSASLHQQLNALLGLHLRAWADPGVDALIGFVVAWTFRGGPKDAVSQLGRFPLPALLLFHAWILLSAAVAVGHNVWQSGSEFSLRGLASMTWLLRWLNFQEDYFPLQDAFFYGVAVIAVIASVAIASRQREAIVKGVAAAVLAGACVNGAFAGWQQATGRGWFAIGVPGIDVNGLWPDIHSFGPFMAFAFMTGVGLLLTRSLPLPSKVAVSVALIAAAIGLHLSGSRATLIIVGLLVLSMCAWGVRRADGRARWFSLLVLIGAAVGFGFALTRGYRGMTLAAFLSNLDNANFNVALSHRPEIWASALRMYSHFPFFGLGQGSFFRLGSESDFSGSEALASMGGSGAHNYFLQSFVELGPLYILVLAWIAIPFLRLGRLNFRFLSFYALAGICIGNVYAHSLLVRETLMLAAIFAGFYFVEASDGARERGLALRPTFGVRRAVVAGALLLAAAAVDAALSFGKAPFQYAAKCHEVQPIAWDGWTQGTVRAEIPQGADTVRLALVADRRDVGERPVDVTVAIVGPDGARSEVRRLRFEGERRGPVDVALSASTPAPGQRYLEITTSNCFVPLNVGRGHDPRHLGVRVTEIEFRQ